MASRNDVTQLAAKLREFGKTLPAEEKVVLDAMIERAMNDPLSEEDLNAISGGVTAWAQGGCFSPGRTANPPKKITQTK